MNLSPSERPTAIELHDIFEFWYGSIRGKKDKKEKFGYKGKEIRKAFEEADKEIPKILTLYEKNSDAVYTSRAFTFSNSLPKPVNSSIITSEVGDLELNDLEISD
ncbi:unnamed protein product [Rhizophagus irregularis]|nr:unnamed protein product [Rhizophagus irregularis]CAB5195580.1 unnamed protein product [Rhizophagus irregularis]CAB5195581.1 unnamed protein product [Rhizophagus irregularis]